MVMHSDIKERYVTHMRGVYKRERVNTLSLLSLTSEFQSFALLFPHGSVVDSPSSRVSFSPKDRLTSPMMPFCRDQSAFVPIGFGKRSLSLSLSLSLFFSLARARD